jgi:hypothetical protein
MLRFVAERWNVDAARVCLTGLSDGGTYALLCGLGADSPFTALACVSGVLHPRNVSNGNLARARGRRVYLAHGALDWLFPVAVARMDATRRGAGADVTITAKTSGPRVRTTPSCAGSIRRSTTCGAREAAPCPGSSGAVHWSCHTTAASTIGARCLAGRLSVARRAMESRLPQHAAPLARADRTLDAGASSAYSASALPTAVASARARS